MPTIEITFDEDTSHSFLLNQIITKLSKRKPGPCEHFPPHMRRCHNHVFASRKEIIEEWGMLLRLEDEGKIRISDSIA